MMYPVHDLDHRPEHEGWNWEGEPDRRGVCRAAVYSDKHYDDQGDRHEDEPRMAQYSRRQARSFFLPIRGGVNVTTFLRGHVDLHVTNLLSRGEGNA